MNEILKAWINPQLIEEMDQGVINAPQDLLGMHYYEGMQLFIVRRRDMSFLSDYFRRDARRYDNGFELY